MRYPFRINKIDKLVLKSYVGPFLVTFVLSLFLFLIQFLWKYIDELVGKGIPGGVLVKLIGLSLADLVPMALPLTVMVAGLMTFGNLSESFELVAMKANGISLLRILRPVFVFMSILVGLNFLFLNFVIPKANLEFKAMLLDLRSKKPAFNIDAGQFYQQIEGVSIRVGHKEADNETVKDMLIYEYKKDDSKRLNVIRAKEGKMVMSNDKRMLNLTLFNGVRYEEMTSAENYRRTYPFNLMYFEKQSMAIDLSSLDINFSNREIMATDYRLLNILQLQLEIDSFNMRMDKHYLDNNRYLGRLIHYPTIFEQMGTPKKLDLNNYKNLNNPNILSNFDTAQHQSIRALAVSMARGTKGTIDGLASTKEYECKDVALYKSEWHKKFSYSFLLMMLFLIAAPLGAIIQKGGIGLPLVISVLLFVLFYAINITGEKMGKELVVPVWFGMWMSTLVLLPIAIVITSKALQDKSLWSGFKLNTRLVSAIAFLKLKVKKKS
jgi:lipopolysaccharide export system permease protein